MSWEPEGNQAISVTFRFRDDAPAYGCLVEAFDSEDASIGYVSARPQGQDERVMTMNLDQGKSSAVKRVAVTDCDV